MAIDTPRQGDRPGETAGRERSTPAPAPSYRRTLTPAEQRVERELHGRQPHEVARMMVAYPGREYGEVAERMHELQRHVRPREHEFGVAGFDPTSFPRELDFRLTQRERSAAEHDQRPAGERADAIERYGEEIRSTVNYAGDGPPELTAALEVEIGFAARYQDLHGIEQQVEVQRDHARMLWRAETDAYSEKPYRDAAARPAPAKPASSATSDTEHALRVATPPRSESPAKAADPAAKTEDPNVVRMRNAREAMWLNYGRDRGLT